MSGLQHRGYDSNNDQFVYWTAPKWDPNGNFYDGAVSFSDLSDIVIAEADVTLVKSTGGLAGAALIDGESSENGDPMGNGSGAGINIEGYPEVNVYWHLTETSATAEVRFWLYDGNIWVPEQNDIKTFDNAVGRDILDPFNVKGGISEIYAEIVTAPSSGNLNVYVTPHNN